MMWPISTLPYRNWTILIIDLAMACEAAVLGQFRSCAD